MKNMIGNLIKDNIHVDDKMIALNMLAAAKEAALLYLDAALTSSTPELRCIYSASLTQMVECHTALTELSITKGWIKPYDDSAKQLQCTFGELTNLMKETK